MTWPNHALQSTAAGRRGCNQRVSWPPSLSLARRERIATDCNWRGIS